MKCSLSQLLLCCVALCTISIVLKFGYFHRLVLLGEWHSLYQRSIDQLQNHGNLSTVVPRRYSSKCFFTEHQKLMKKNLRVKEKYEDIDSCMQSFKSWSHGVVTVLQPEVLVNCSKLLKGESNEVVQVRETMSQWKSAMSSHRLLSKVQNCTWLREYMMNNFYNSKLERDFPLAFTLVVHDSPEQVLRLLRVLYREQNSFCIHCDAKSPYRIFFQSIASCFENVVIPPVLERVIWGHSSILEAQAKCVTELIKLRGMRVYKWKYLLNLCGKEIPLVTNREMVIQLMKLNGTSNINPKKVEVHQTEFYSRIKYRIILDRNKTKIFIDKNSSIGDPPFNVSKYYYKSSGYHALSFQFANYITCNDTALKILMFFQHCKNPEEHYYASVFMMPEVPGGYREATRSYSDVVGVFWVPPHNCSGKVVHRVCITTAGDLAKAVSYGRGKFFHNKYFMEHDHSVMNCMEERLVARNKKEYDIDCIEGHSRQLLGTPQKTL